MILFSSFKAVRQLVKSTLPSAEKSFRWSEYTFQSTLQLNSFVEMLLEPVSCKKTTVRLELGLHEALVNAVMHGNEGDPKKALRVRRILTPNWMVWQIQDQGEGIPFDSRNSSLPEELEAVSGRGLYLIHQCFDDVRWSRRGNRLQLACRRPKSLNDEGNQDLLLLS